MNLSTATRLGPYEVVSILGAGAMVESDTVLPDDLRDALTRFN
jgi:hypothetical protein